MKKLSSPFVISALAGLACAVSSAPSWAYMPPSAYIVKSMAAKHAGPKGMRVRTVVTAMDGDQPTSVRFKTVTHFNPQTQVLRAYALDETSGRRLYGVERKVDSSTAADAVLFWSNPKNVALALKAKGIPVRTEDELLKMKDEEERRASETGFLIRWNNTIAWVIGRKTPPDEPVSEPQLWVEKDTFLPLRLVAGPISDDTLFDIQFEGQRYYREFPYPKTIVALRKKEPILRDEVQDIALVLDASEFRSAPPTGFTEAGKSASGAVRDLIRRYFELIR